MPRKPRKMRLGISLPGMFPPEPAAEPLPAEAPSWHVTEVLRVRCPLCGMLPEAFRLENAPYKTEVKLQRFGGRLKGGRGFMVYEAAPEERAAPVKVKLKEKLAELCKLAQKEEG